MPSGNDLPLEFRLLALSAGGRVTAPEGERLEQLCSGLMDWNTFLAHVERHRVPGLAYLNLNRFASDRMPRSTHGKLRTLALENKRQSLVLGAELIRLAKQFEIAGIPVWSLKGPLLSQQLFGDLGIRHSKDLDLIVRREDFDQAEPLLHIWGYQRAYPERGYSARQLEIYSEFSPHIGYIQTERQINLELHWRVPQYPLLSPAQVREMMEHSEVVSFGGLPVRTFAEQDLIILLLVHGALHSWERIKWLSDIAAFQRRETPVNWVALAERMSEMGLGQILAQALLLTHTLFELAIPASLQSWVDRETVAPWLAHRAIQIMLAPIESAPGFTTWLTRRMYFLRLKRDLSYWRFCFKLMLFRPEDWRDLRLPDSLVPLYFFLRPFLTLRRRLFRRSHA